MIILNKRIDSPFGNVLNGTGYKPFIICVGIRPKILEKKERGYFPAPNLPNEASYGDVNIRTLNAQGENEYMRAQRQS